MTQRAAIVTTVRNPGPSFESFLRYHSAIGFDHILVFFDDPHDAAIETARSFCNVTIKRNDARLRKLWADTQIAAKSPYFVSFWKSELMARQSLNAEIAIQLAAQKKIDWLLHIDCDELFYLFDGNVSEHFQSLTERRVKNAVYANYEAIPEALRITDFFKKVSLFKRNFWLSPKQRLNSRQRSIIKKVPQLPDDLFMFYRNGKSAARIRAGLLPDGAHRFVQQPPGRRAGSFFCDDAVILHYACCGFRNFWSKYETLGYFADKWFDSVDIAKTMGSFHLESRDVVARGDEHAGRKFYRERVLMNDPAAIRSLLDNRIACRITEPGRTLITKS